MAPSGGVAEVVRGVSGHTLQMGFAGECVGWEESGVTV